MKKSLFLWQIIGFVSVSVLGVLLHFLYGWTGESLLVAPFSAVNESVFEHMKLFFMPAFAFALIQAKFLKDDYNSFLCIKLCGILKGTLLIPILYYSYTGIFGRSADWFNITIFFIAAAVAFISEYRKLRKNKRCLLSNKLALIVFSLLAVLFVTFTFFPPYIPLFQDPLTKLYGI